jgi:hypothetical protein
MWAGLKMDGLTTDLQEPKTVEWLHFYESGEIVRELQQFDGPEGFTGPWEMVIGVGTKQDGLTIR